MAPELRLKEYAKIGLRSVLRHYNLDLIRNPYSMRLVSTLKWLSVENVLDVGANIGQYASALRSAGYGGSIYSFEPLSDAFAHLERRAHRDPSWTVMQTAVGAESAVADIQVSANSYSSSILPMTAAHLHAAPDSRVVRVDRVAVTTVADVVSKFGIIASRTMLKVDTQGFEGPVLDGAADLLGGFCAVQLELSFVPLYDTQELFGPLVARLNDHGFELFGLDPGICDPATGRLLQCDGLFVHRRHLGAGPMTHA